jgi:hypothetical protein
MSTTTVPDDTAGKIKRNAEIAFKSLSSYVVIAASALAAVWLGLTDAQQTAFIAAHPILTPLAPYLAAVAWLAAKLAPQNIVLSADKDALRQHAIDWLNQLVAKGAAPGEAVPVPATVAKALGMAVPVVAVPLAPAVEPAPVPAPAAVVEANLAAVTHPADPMTAVRSLFPGQTDDQIRAALLPKPVAPVAQPTIVVAQ